MVLTQIALIKDTASGEDSASSPSWAWPAGRLDQKNPRQSKSSNIQGRTRVSRRQQLSTANKGTKKKKFNGKKKKTPLWSVKKDCEIYLSAGRVGFDSCCPLPSPVFLLPCSTEWPSFEGIPPEPSVSLVLVIRWRHLALRLCVQTTVDPKRYRQKNQ